MYQSKLTYIFCLDELRNFSDDLKKRFSDTSKYKVIITQNKEELKRYIARIKENKTCKITIIGSHTLDTESGYTDELVSDLRNSDTDTYIIVLASQPEIEKMKDKIKVDADAFIPLNINSIHMVHNTVKKRISEFNLQIFRTRSIISLWFLIISFLAFLIFAVVAYFWLPLYF